MPSDLRVKYNSVWKRVSRLSIHGRLSMGVFWLNIQLPVLMPSVSAAARARL